MVCVPSPLWGGTGWGAAANRSTGRACNIDDRPAGREAMTMSKSAEILTPVSRARALRKTMTLHEKKLWAQLRLLRTQEFHFRRQAPLLGYVLDFACFSRRIIVECDGSHHANGMQLASDARRDAIFAAEGFLTLRFWNNDIDDNLDGIVETILARAFEHQP